MDRRMVESYLRPLTPQPARLAPEGELRRPIKCLLCDVYGTLLISGSGDIGILRQMDAGEKSLIALLRKYKVERAVEDLRRDLFAAIEEDHHRKITRGIDYPEVEIDKIWAKILPFGEPEDVRAFAAQWEMVVNPVWPMPGLSELIQSCRDGNLTLGIISNAQFYTPLLFDWLLGADLEVLGFDPRLTFYSYQHGLAKPSLFMFELAAERLEAYDITRDQTAYIGNDMRNDIVPARRTGFQTILFGGDGRSLRLRSEDPECEGYTPDAQVNRLNKVAQLII